MKFELCQGVLWALIVITIARYSYTITEIIVEHLK